MAPRPPSERQLRLAESARRSTAGKRTKPTSSSSSSSTPRPSSTTTTTSTPPTQRTHFFPSSISDDNPFSTTKKDKRHIRHSQLLHRVRSSSAATAGTSKASVKNMKRRQVRRDGNTLARLDDLVDALPADAVAAAVEEQRLLGKEDSDSDVIDGDHTTNKTEGFGIAVSRRRDGGALTGIDHATEGVRKAYSSTPGVLKRRERVVKQERMVFERTLAAIGRVPGDAGVPAQPTTTTAAVAATTTTNKNKKGWQDNKGGAEMSARTTNQWELLRSAITMMKSA